MLDGKLLKKIYNAAEMPKVYYGLHMVEGVAEYNPPDGEPYRVLILENTIKQMDPTFSGKPVYVDHVEDVKVEDVERADGYVIESFYNKSDGKHWSKFIVVTDKGHQAIKNGWNLSNAYHVKKEGAGGRWHNVEYKNEILEGEYEHLAIVLRPRYSESKILTPSEFKDYNQQKEAELHRLANSVDENENKNKKGDTIMFFKKTKVENSDDLMKMSVRLPKSKVDMKVSDLIANADDAEANKDKEKMANEGDMVEVDGKKMSVSNLVKSYKNMCKKKNEEEDLENEDDLENEGEPSAAEKEKENEEDDKKENKKKKNKRKNSQEFDDLSNAHIRNSVQNEIEIELGSDQIKRGTERYG